MTETHPDTADALEALELASAAGRASGVEVRELIESAEYRDAEELLAAVWLSNPDHCPVSRDVMRALAFTGGYVAGAYVAQSLVAVSVGMLAVEDHEPGEPTAQPSSRPQLQLHSHVTAVAGSMRGARVGQAMKLHQRAWALHRGIRTITWTFDPLVERNAYFNLVKLRASATAYLVDFYGEMDDELNKGQGTDRLWTRWELAPSAPHPCKRAGQVDLEVSELIAAGQVRLDRGPGGEPTLIHPRSAREPFACALPVDIEAMRVKDPSGARSWRSAVREVLAPALGNGCSIAGYARSGWYLITPNTEQRDR